MTRTHDLNPVRRRREQLGLQLGELGRQVLKTDGRPIGAPLMSMIEHGYVPKVPTQRAIADALRTTPADLWPVEYA